LPFPGSSNATQFFINLILKPRFCRNQFTYPVSAETISYQTVLDRYSAKIRIKNKFYILLRYTEYHMATHKELFSIFHATTGKTTHTPRGEPSVQELMHYQESRVKRYFAQSNQMTRWK